MKPVLHGGPDALGVPRFDFSTNSNACGPCPVALAAVQQADPTCYPDPQYTALRTRLADFHGVDARRVVLAASASAFIHQFSAWVAKTTTSTDTSTGGAAVCVPQHHYGDYAHAAQVAGLAITHDPAHAQLLWGCEPSSPLGQAQPELLQWVDGLHAASQHLVLDCAYAPLRLSGKPSLSAAQFNRVWQMLTPNKALGLTGVRAAYVLAPLGAEQVAAALTTEAPSWPVGAHGVAMLEAWCTPATQQWLSQSLQTLQVWKARQVAMLEEQGWACLPSDANFFCARPAESSAIDVPQMLHTLRSHGIKLRDATSFGLPGRVRLGVLAPAAHVALVQVLAQL